MRIDSKNDNRASGKQISPVDIIAKFGIFIKYVLIITGILLLIVLLIAGNRIYNKTVLENTKYRVSILSNGCEVWMDNSLPNNTEISLGFGVVKKENSKLITNALISVKDKPGANSGQFAFVPVSAFAVYLPSSHLGDWPQIKNGDTLVRSTDKPEAIKPLIDLIIKGNFNFSFGTEGQKEQIYEIKTPVPLEILNNFEKCYSRFAASTVETP